MSIQYDIADVLEEVGLSFTIERIGVSLPDVVEYLTYTPNSQVTKPFIREHFLEVAFKSETQVIAGDIITFITSGYSYLVMNNSPDFFEGEIIRYLAVLYKTNVTVDIFRPQNTTVGYDTSFAFAPIYLVQKALIYAPLFGNKGEINADIGFMYDEKEEMYFPTAYVIKMNDRVVLHGTSEKYVVSTVIKRRYAGVSVIILDEDNRE